MRSSGTMALINYVTEIHFGAGVLADLTVSYTHLTLPTKRIV